MNQLTLHYPLLNTSLQDLKITEEILYWIPWIADLKNKNKNIWLALSMDWKPDGGLPDSPPKGYEYYIVSGDSNLFGFAEKIAQYTGGKVIQQMAASHVPDSTNNLVKYVPYTNIHRLISRMPTNWPIDKNITYKASALTNRLTQSKAIIFSALTSLLDKQDFVGSLNHAYESSLLKNVHNWEISGNAVCDKHTKNFIDNWLDKQVILPNDDRLEGSYNNPAYQNSALNFTQESYHYSYMTDDRGNSYIEPGPFLTEKTFKCLLSKTAFIPVGQYQSYTWLEQLGMKFNYGELNLDFDNDPGNLTRLEKIVGLIESLEQWSAQDLYEMTRASTEYNYDYVQSEDFWNTCEKFNTNTIDYLFNL
jgi:hypothetical protein